MSNPNEGYAFITKAGWSGYLSEIYPHAIDIGDSYKMIQFALTEEFKLRSLAKTLGFEVRELTVDDTISAMESGMIGPYLVYSDDVHTVVDKFNPSEMLDV